MRTGRESSGKAAGRKSATPYKSAVHINVWKKAEEVWAKVPDPCIR